MTLKYVICFEETRDYVPGTEIFETQESAIKEIENSDSPESFFVAEIEESELQKILS